MSEVTSVSSDEEGNVTLATLLRGEAVGARLEKMLANGPLGAMTLRDIMLDRERVVEWMLNQPNCGRTTVDELMTLIESQPRRIIRPPERWPEPPLADIELAELLTADRLSARLADVLGKTELGSTTLPEFIRSRSKIEGEMLRVPNCGRRSVTELRGLVGKHVRHQLEQQLRDPASFGPEFAAFVEGAPTDAAECEHPSADCDLRELVSWHLKRLPERTANVITLRYGLGDAPPMTLGDIGDDYGLTRERIRQIEAKGIKTLLTACRRFPVRAAVDEASDDLLKTVFGNALHVSVAAADRAISSLDGWHELALLLAHGGGTEWFRRHARKLGTGWLAIGADTGEAKALSVELRRRAKARPFPRAIDEMCQGLDLGLATAAMELLRGWHVEGGYIFDRRPGPRLRRTARLHALLAQEHLLVEMAPLLRSYHAITPTDPCTDRDLVIVMEAASHLFLEIHEGCWTAIGTAAPIDAPDRADPTEPEQSAVHVAPDAGTNAAALERELERAGPSRLGALMARAVDILPEGRSRHSVGPTLLLNPTRFVRVLPGVYALPNQVLDGRSLVQAGALDYLLNPIQARFYAVARKSGESWGAFPLWNATAEMRLCRWARAGEERALFRSLLDIASIDDWPTDEADKEVWHGLRSREGRYEIWCERRQGGARPPIDGVLAAAIRLARVGSIGWAAANRILGYIPSSYAGAGLLAGMVRAGIASQPDAENGWQLPHRPAPRLAEWIERLAGPLHETGEINWATGAGVELAVAFSAAGESADLAADEPEEMDDYERIMAEHRQSVQARRIEARLELEAE